MGIATKICNSCREEQSLDEFYRGYICRSCRRDQNDMLHWGYTRAQITAIYGDVCGICKQPETLVRLGKVRQLCIDHDHSCCPVGCKNCIRGLLCWDCNKKLGVVEDEEWLEDALDYLKRSYGN